MEIDTYFTRSLYQADAATLLANSRQRMLGELGPMVDYNESWGEILVQAYQQGTAAYRARYSAMLAQHIMITPAQIAALQTDTQGEWQYRVTALQSAADIQWMSGEQKDRLVQWLDQRMHDLPESIPRERAKQGDGYPQTDYLATLSRLVTDLLPRDPGFAEAVWSRCRQAQPKETNIQRIARAERYWWLAQWAMRWDTATQPWLAQHMDCFSQALEAADGWPGDLIRFFISVEHQGTCELQRLARLIQHVPHPTDRARRQQLATQLYYFDANQEALQEEWLNNMYNAQVPKQCNRPRNLRLVASQPAKPETSRPMVQSPKPRYTADPASYPTRLRRSA